MVFRLAYPKIDNFLSSTRSVVNWCITFCSHFHTFKHTNLPKQFDEPYKDIKNDIQSIQNRISSLKCHALGHALHRKTKIMHLLFNEKSIKSNRL